MSRTGIRALVPGAALAALLLAAGACRTSPPPSKLDISQPGWTVRQGQAVWQSRPGGTEVAGDLLVATMPDGHAFVQFSKSPLTLAAAEQAPGRWQLEFPMEHKRYAGEGPDVPRILWFVLAGAVNGTPPPAPWKWRLSDAGSWRLENSKSGESLEGFFTP